MKKIIGIITTILVIWIIVPRHPVYAVACTPPISGNLTISSDCSFSGTVNGVDSGSGSTNTSILTISAGILTINTSQTIGFGSMVLSGGSVALSANNTGALKPGALLWMVDADGDGYSPDGVQYVQESAPANGRRRSVMLGTTTDCYDSNANAFPGQTSWFTVQRGDSSFDYNCDSTVTYGRETCVCANPVCAPTCECTFGIIAGDYTCGALSVAGPNGCTCSRRDGYGNCTGTCTNQNGSQSKTVNCR